MDGMLALLKPILDSRSDRTVLRSYLSSWSDQLSCVKDPSNLSTLFSLINAKLNEPSTRADGYLLLQSILPHCSREALACNASTWMLLCLKGTSGPLSSPLAFKVLQILFKYTSEVPEMTKVVAASVIPNLAEQMSHGVAPQCLHPALECLEECMDKYNGSCGPHRRVWEHIIFPLVDFSGRQSNLVKMQAARCMALLPQIGGGSTGGTLYASNWYDQQRVLCRSIHLVLDELYADVKEVQVYQAAEILEGCESLPLPLLEHSNPLLNMQKLAARLGGLVNYLEALLLLRFPVPKKISLSSILTVVCRGLAVTTTVLETRKTTHSLALASVLPQVHLSLLSLLSSLIVVCRNNLLSFATTICKIVVQTLKWTRVDKCPYGTEKPFRSIRHMAYKVITLWCGIAKSGSLVEDFAELLIEMAMADFCTAQDSLMLSAGLTRRNKYADRKQKKSVNVIGASRTTSFVSNSANSCLCEAALQAMTAMLAAASSFISPTIHKTLQEAVVSLLLELTRNNFQPPIPFSVSAPRLELYRLLLASVLNPHPVWPPPHSVALKLFAYGQNDKDVQISMFCVFAQNCVEKIIHPAHTSLHFQVPSDSILSIAKGSESKTIPVECANDVSSDAEGSEMTNCASEVQAMIIAESETTQTPKKSFKRKSSIPVQKIPQKEAKLSITFNSGCKSEDQSGADFLPRFSTSVGQNRHLKTIIEEADHSQQERKSHTTQIKEVEIDSDASTELNYSTTSAAGMIDLADSNSEKNSLNSDVEEVPCEIDIAESDDSDIESSTPIIPRALRLPKDRISASHDRQQKELSQLRSEENAALAAEISVSSPNTSPARDTQLLEPSSQISPESSTELTQRILRSRTISSSSLSSQLSTPKKMRALLDPPFEPSEGTISEEREESVLNTQDSEKQECKTNSCELDKDFEDDNLDAMLLSFVDVTQGESGV